MESQKAKFTKLQEDYTLLLHKQKTQVSAEYLQKRW